MPTFDARAPKVTIKVHRGDQWNIPLHFTLNGSDYNLTPYTFKAQIRTQPNDAPFLEMEIQDLQANVGLLTLMVPENLTVLDPEGDSFDGTYFWDLEADHPVVGPRTWLRGTWVVVPDVTKE